MSRLFHIYISAFLRYNYSGESWYDEYFKTHRKKSSFLSSYLLDNRLFSVFDDISFIPSAERPCNRRNQRVSHRHPRGIQNQCDDVYQYIECNTHPIELCTLRKEQNSRPIARHSFIHCHFKLYEIPCRYTDRNFYVRYADGRHRSYSLWGCQRIGI